MSHLNVEIKASLPVTNENGEDDSVQSFNATQIRNYLLSHGAEFKGTDNQTDTYFMVPNGRLKLREGNIENNLIYYERTNQAGPKDSYFNLVKVEDARGIKEALTKSIGVMVVVIKRREIFYIKNVKFHIDEIMSLGSFVEIEAGNLLDSLTQEQLNEQCDFYMKEFRINENDLIAISYSDMVLQKMK